MEFFNQPCVKFKLPRLHLATRNEDREGRLHFLPARSEAYKSEFDGAADKLKSAVKVLGKK